MTKRQELLYQYLQDNCVGYKNVIPRKELAIKINNLLIDAKSMDFYDTEKGEGIQHDIREIRQNPDCKLRICSNTTGYWIPTGPEELDKDMLVARAIGHIETCLESGIISASYFHKVLWNITHPNEIPSSQLVIDLSEETNTKEFGREKIDLENLSIQQLRESYRNLCFQLGECPMILSKPEYIKEIERLEKLCNK